MLPSKLKGQLTDIPSHVTITRCPPVTTPEVTASEQVLVHREQNLGNHSFFSWGYRAPKRTPEY